MLRSYTWLCIHDLQMVVLRELYGMPSAMCKANTLPTHCTIILTQYLYIVWTFFFFNWIIMRRTITKLFMDHIWCQIFELGLVACKSGRRPWISLQPIWRLRNIPGLLLSSLQSFWINHLICDVETVWIWASFQTRCVSDSSSFAPVGFEEFSFCCFVFRPYPAIDTQRKLWYQRWKLGFCMHNICLTHWTISVASQKFVLFLVFGGMSWVLLL